MDRSKQCLLKIKRLLDSIEDDNLPGNGSSSLGWARQLTLPMQRDAGSPNEFNCPKRPEDCLLALKNLPGRGVGVVATRLIPADTIILKEDATLTVPTSKPTTPEYLLALVSQYVSCSAEVRKEVMTLHAHNSPDREVDICSVLATWLADVRFTGQQVKLIILLSSIFSTNMFDDTAPGASSVYLQASRFNHSCVPNCDYGHTSDGQRPTVAIRASRDIQPGEELCVPYTDYYEDREMRMSGLKHNWGFVCNCPACDEGNPEVDTEAHEEMLGEYRRLKKDPHAHVLFSCGRQTLWSKELDEALGRSIRRSEIAEAMGDIHASTMNHIVSARACKEKWLWTGNQEDFKRHVRFLEQGQLLANRTAPSRPGQDFKLMLEKDLSEAQKLSDT